MNYLRCHDDIGWGLDALGGEYHTPEGTSVWLADVELKPYQALMVRR